MRSRRPERRLSNRAIIGIGLALCIALAVVVAWFFGAWRSPVTSSASAYAPGSRVFGCVGGYPSAAFPGFMASAPIPRPASRA